MMWACIQPNGEQIPVEDWAYRAVREGRLRDPMVCAFVLRAVEVRPFGWPRRSWEVRR